MIGGHDVRLTLQVAKEDALEAALRSVEAVWPQAVFVNAETGEEYEHSWQVPLGMVDEIIVYRDEKTHGCWVKEGAVPELYDTSVYFIADDDVLTLSVDSIESEVVQSILRGIHSRLREASFLGEPLKEAA